MRTIDIQLSSNAITSERPTTTLDVDLVPVLDTLVDDKPLDPRYHDHALFGEWKDYRDCHIKPDPVLIYQIPDASVIRLVRLGSHSELVM